METIEIIIALLIGGFCGALADILVKRYYSRKRKKKSLWLFCRCTIRFVCIRKVSMCEKHPSDMNKTSAKPFMRTILYSLFMAVLLAISFIFTRSFAWVLLVCFLPMVVFFFIDDLKRKRKHDTVWLYTIHFYAIRKSRNIKQNQERRTFRSAVLWLTVNCCSQKIQLWK